MDNHCSLRTALIVLLLPLALTLSGCALLGLGAAAGAAVGGCALVDENEDERVTREELSAGIFNSWDTDDNSVLTEAEFEAGVNRREIYSDWSGEFSSWDTDNDDTLSRAEFDAGVAADEGTTAWLDRRCDELGL